MVKSVPSIWQNKGVQEAKKLGFETCILPKSILTDEVRTDGIRLIGVSNVREAISCISDGEH